jgi:hypothetical protein
VESKTGPGYQSGPVFVALFKSMADTIRMTRPSLRFLLIACCVIVQFHPPACAKESKAKEKDISDLAYGLFRDGSTPSKEMLVTLVHQLHWDNGAAGNLDRQAYHLRFEKVGETQTPEGSVPRYRIFAEGLPENKVYGLGIWEVGKPMKSPDHDVYVNEQGLLMTHRPHPEEEIASRLPGDELIVSPTGSSGEPTRYAIISRDNEVTAYGTLVPHPVVSLEGSCRLEARVAAPGSAAVLIVADGFAPQTRLPVVLESLGEVSNIYVVTDRNGHAELAGFPFIQGKTQGTLKASAEGEDCLPSVQLTWDSGTATTAELKK